MTTGNMSLVHRLRHTKVYSDVIPLGQKSCIRIVFVKARLLSRPLESRSLEKEVSSDIKTYLFQQRDWDLQDFPVNRPLLSLLCLPGDLCLQHPHLQPGLPFHLSPQLLLVQAHLWVLQQIPEDEQLTDVRALQQKPVTKNQLG